MLFAYSTPAFADAAFQTWLQSLWPQAQALGVSRATFDLATRGLEPDLSLPDLVLPGRPERPSGGQAEFVLTPADYLKEPTFDSLAARGRKLFDQYRDTLTAIEKQFGVPPAIVLAIFGRETDYGSARDKRNAIRVLATQAYLGKRKEKFLDEFLQALKILDEGQVKLADMTSSWAGAMGLTQFMPSDYVKYAVDFDGDGHRNIWTSVPDALASAAKQLRAKAGSAACAGPTRCIRRPMSIAPSACRTTRCRSANGSSAVLCRPMAARCRRRSAPSPRRCCNRPGSTARRSSPPRIISSSRNIISPISTCCSSAISPTASPTRGRSRRRGARSAQMPTADLDRMQHILTDRGFYHDKIDGKAGMLTRSALGAYQKRNGLKVDCWPTAAVLAHMEKAGN